MQRAACPVHFGFGLLRLTCSEQTGSSIRKQSGAAATTTTSSEVAPGNQSISFICSTNKNVSYPMFDFLYLFYSRAQSQAKNKLKSLWHFERYSYKSTDTQRYTLIWHITIFAAGLSLMGYITAKELF